MEGITATITTYKTINWHMLHRKLVSNSKRLTNYQYNSIFHLINRAITTLILQLWTIHRQLHLNALQHQIKPCQANHSKAMRNYETTRMQGWCILVIKSTLRLLSIMGINHPSKSNQQHRSNHYSRVILPNYNNTNQLKCSHNSNNINPQSLKLIH